MFPMRASTRHLSLLQRSHARDRGLASATFFGLLLVGLLAGCGNGGSSSGGGGSSSPSSVTQVVGSAGGTVSLPDGTNVTFSSGVVNDGTVVTVSSLSKPPETLPDGIRQLAPPISVLIPPGGLSGILGDQQTVTVDLSSSNVVAARANGSLALAQTSLLQPTYQVFQATIHWGNNLIRGFLTPNQELGRIKTIFTPAAVCPNPLTLQSCLQSLAESGTELIATYEDIQDCFSQGVSKLYSLNGDGTFALAGNTPSGGGDSRTPLILVHGTQEFNALFTLGIGCRTAYATAWSAFLQVYRGKDTSLSNAFKVYSFAYNSTGSIDVNGADLAATLQRQFPQQSVVILAHSMGGLVARSALVSHSANIQGIVSLATPYHGTPAASSELRKTWIELIDFAAGLSLGERDLAWDNLDGKTFHDVTGNLGNAFLAQLKAGETDNHRKKYLAYAAESNPSLQGSLFYQQKLLNCPPYDCNYRNDDFVPINSAQLSDLLAANQAKLFPNVDHSNIKDNSSVLEEVRQALLSFLITQPPPPPSTFTLAVTKQGTGTGTVTSSGGGINCGTVCTSQPITGGDSVVLTAAPGSDSTFTGWGGGGCSGAGTCTVAMNANQNVTVTFNLVSPPPPPQGIWSATGSMATGRDLPTATLLPTGKVLVVGGSTNAAFGIASAELYDPAANGGAGAWTPTGSLATGRYGQTATLLQNGKVLVVGGRNNVVGALASAELYDPAANSGAGAWTPTGSLATARLQHTATLLLNGKVLVVGGQTSTNGNVSNILASAELYDPTANGGAGAWSTTGNLMTARVEHTATLLLSGKVLVVGGRTSTNVNGSNIFANAELYDPAANGGAGAWSTTGSQTFGRSGHTATLLQNGKVLVVGGNSPHPLPIAELYDPAANGGAGAWSATGFLAATRSGHTATLLPTGKVLVVGGYGDISLLGLPSFSLASAELYDPAANGGAGAWSTTGSLATARQFHTATLLPNGKVLVAGGESSSGILDSAELFQ